MQNILIFPFCFCGVIQSLLHEIHCYICSNADTFISLITLVFMAFESDIICLTLEHLMLSLKGLSE